MKTLSLKLPESLDVALAAEARRQGTTKSALVRDAVEKVVQGRGGSRGRSCMDLAADLAGCVDGPRDLATSKHHLKGFGQ